MAHGDVAEARVFGHPVRRRQVFQDRECALVESEASLLHELEDGERRDRLADAANAEQRRWGRGDDRARILVREAVALGVRELAFVGDGDGAAGRAERGKDLLHLAVDGVRERLARLGEADAGLCRGGDKGEKNQR